jgi:hypothetical protein
MGQSQPPLGAEVEAEIRETQHIIKGYAEVMQGIDGVSFYDILLLPHPKDAIAKALLLAIKLTGDQHQRENLKGALGILTRFQDNVGQKPVRPSPDLPNGGQTTPEEFLKAYEAHQPESERFNELQQRAALEEKAFSDMVDTLLRM